MADFFEPDLESIGEEDKSFDFWKPQDNKDNVIRILPPWEKGKQFYKPYKMHFGLDALKEYGLEIDGWFAEPCLALETDKCPLCAKINEAFVLGTRQEDIKLNELYRKLRAKRQWVSNILDMKEAEKGPQVYPYGQKVFDRLRQLFAKWKNITHIETGRNITIIKTYNGQWPEYTVDIDEVDDITEHWDKFHDKLNNLSDFPLLAEYSALQRKVEDVDFEPIKARAKPTVTKTKTEEEDFDISLEDDNDGIEEFLSGKTDSKDDLPF
jgi:hypothetical protein